MADGDDSLPLFLLVHWHAFADCDYHVCVTFGLVSIVVSFLFICTFLSRVLFSESI